MLNSMVKLLQLVGIYTLTGTKMTKDDLTGHLQIVTRKQVTLSKPIHYIVYKSPEYPRGEYISSMYPTDDPRVYRMESGGQWYTVTQTSQTRADILPLNINRQNVSNLDTDTKSEAQ